MHIIASLALKLISRNLAGLRVTPNSGVGSHSIPIKWRDY